jgi:branched-chain amino acid transport system ATP-binding protein
MTVLENVMTGAFLRSPSKAGARTKAEEVLRFTALWEKRDMVATSITIPDKKKLEVAMALATEPKLLMLDEAMAGLTPFELKEMLSLVRKVRENGMSLVIVEHVMEAVMALSDRVIGINSGRKIVEDVPEKIVVHPEVIRAYLGERYHARS